MANACRAPQGARGLKYSDDYLDGSALGLSRPARGAWVEMAERPRGDAADGVAPRKGRVG